jgi:quercetin dioxygenase-like cupin family protein
MFLRRDSNSPRQRFLGASAAGLEATITARFAVRSGLDDYRSSEGSGRDQLEEEGMPHVAVTDAASAVVVQAGAVVSKVIHRDQNLDVTVFGFDAGEGLTEHRASRTALVQVLAGRLRLTVDGEDLDAGPGFLLYMAPDTPHALVASEPTTMLLTLVRTVPTGRS